MVTAVINPVLFHVKDCKKEYVLHHDHLKPCEDMVVPLWLCIMRHSMLDLDTTIAYDEAEQDNEMPSSTPSDTSSSPLFTEDESSEVLDTQDSESTASTPLSCESTDSDNIGEGVSQEPGPQPPAPLYPPLLILRLKRPLTFSWGGGIRVGQIVQRNGSCPCSKTPGSSGKTTVITGVTIEEITKDKEKGKSSCRNSL